MILGIMPENNQERLEDFIALADKNDGMRLATQLRKEIVRHRSREEATDDITSETDIFLLMADFILEGAEGGPHEVTKIYAFGPLNETEIRQKTVRHIANERLKGDYQRFVDAGIEVDEKFF